MKTLIAAILFFCPFLATAQTTNITVTVPVTALAGVTNASEFVTKQLERRARTEAQSKQRNLVEALRRRAEFLSPTDRQTIAAILAKYPDGTEPTNRVARGTNRVTRAQPR